MVEYEYGKLLEETGRGMPWLTGILGILSAQQLHYYLCIRNNWKIK
jgi:hypothetical protein